MSASAECVQAKRTNHPVGHQGEQADLQDQVGQLGLQEPIGQQLSERGQMRQQQHGVLSSDQASWPWQLRSMAMPHM